jgi:serine/threonine protein kinase
MNPESSSFDDLQNNSPILNTFSDVTPIKKTGATSDCYKVRIHGKWHFLKRPKQAFSTNPIYIAAFEKEFDLGFTLDHPNIVRYISKGNDNNGIYILTEYIDGQTLSDFRLNNPDFFKSKENVRRLILQLLAALEYIHNRQIVHLDLKPDNILITNNGNNLKLIDLGLSYSDCYSEITGGTQSFGSPEQFARPELIDFRSDIYAFGKIVLYLFTGNTTLQSIKRLPVKYRQLITECLIEDVDKRNIKASECIQYINRKNISPLLLIGIVLIISLFVIWTVLNRTSKAPITQPEIKQPDTIIIKQSPTNNTKQNSKQNAVGNGTVSKQTIENIIRLAVIKRLSPNNLALTKTYSDINEFNVGVLRKSFADWKNLCNEDCKLLYKDYESQISFDQFKQLYDSELNKINSPIQKRLDEFK